MEAHVFVDLQTFFMAGANRQHREIFLRRIKSARAHSHKIFFLEYEGYGRTLAEFQDAAGPSATYVTKDQDDGSVAILGYVAGYHKIIVHGVNRDYCVKETIEGLHELLPEAMIGMGVTSDSNDFAKGW